MKTESQSMKLPGQKKREEAARRAARTAKDRADYQARRAKAVHKAIEAGLALARAAEQEEAEKASQAAAREAAKKVRAAEDTLRYQRLVAERAAHELAFNEAQAAKDAGDARPFCPKEVTDGVPCWLLPDHTSPCRAAPTPVPPPTPRQKLSLRSAALMLPLLLAGATLGPSKQD